MLKSDLLENLRGTLMVVPIMNAFGFHNRSRYLLDRRDGDVVVQGDVLASIFDSFSEVEVDYLAPSAGITFRTRKRR